MYHGVMCHGVVYHVSLAHVYQQQRHEVAHVEADDDVTGTSHVLAHPRYL